MSENISKVQQLYAAFGRGEITTILANVTPDIAWCAEAADSEIPWHRPRKGPDGVADFFATLDREVEFTQFEPTVFADAPQQVLVQLNVGYRLKKNGATGASGAIHQFVFDDSGLVKEFRFYEDTATLRDAWGK